MTITPEARIHRDKALSLMEGRGPILDLAREVSGLLGDRGIVAAVIGGVAVVLHGHWRSTRDIDLLVGADPEAVGAALRGHGFEFDPARREFIRDGVPVHLVLPDQAGTTVGDTVEIEGVRTIPLADLIAMKLRSGTKNLLRAQDLADVIGLIRHHKLSGPFASRIDRSLRPAFRKLVKAVEKGQ